MTDARPELPEIPARDSSGSGNLPHEFDQHFRRIVAVQRGCSGGNIFLAGENIPQFGIFLCRFPVIRIEDLRDSAPA